MYEKERYYGFLEQKRSELRAISFVEGKSKVESIKEVQNKEDFISFCDLWDGKANIYVGIHERVEGGSKKKDVTCVKLIALDIDAIHPKNEAATNEELELCKKETFDMVEELANTYGRPTIIMTGNGFQLLWKIKPININDDNRDLIENKIQKWISSIQKRYNSKNKNIDQIGDLARILKVSGTLSVKGENTKERPFRRAFFIEFNDIISDSLRDNILITELEREKTIYDSKKQKEGKIDKLDYLLTKDPKLSSLYNGNISGFKSRSEAELSLVCKLVYYEFTDSEIDFILRMSDIGKWKGMNKQYKELTISKARLLIREKKDDLKEINIEDVYRVLSKWLYLKDFQMVDLLLAILLSQRLNGSPIWMIFVGASGDGKSEMARTFDNLDFVYKVDQITQNTLVSGNMKAQDLAPQLNNKVLLITDFASILSLGGDAQKSMFAQLRSLYDGEAYKDAGTGARKHYSGIRVTLIANSTPIINHKILIHQDLGTRELMYRTDHNETKGDKEKKALKALDNEGRKDEMRKEIQSTISTFLDNVTEIKKDFPDEMSNFLLKKAKWLSSMRSTATVDGYSGELISNVSEEVPTRLLMQFKVIYLCLKSLDKDYTDEKAKGILLRIINSSAKEIRVNLYQHLQNCSEAVSTSEIAEVLKLGKKTILTECNILWNLGLIECNKIRTENFGREFEMSKWYVVKDKIKEEKV